MHPAGTVRSANTRKGEDAGEGFFFGDAMARIRTIKPEFPHSESMGRVSRDARLCFIMLWTIADDSGRLRGNSRMLASLLFPYDDDAPQAIEKWLKQLAKEGCIHRYESDGSSYIQIAKWADHQKIDKPSPSKIPSFEESSRILANPREQSAMDLDQDLDQGMDQEVDQDGKGSISSETSPEPVVFYMPLVSNDSFPVYQAEISEWISAYPAVDILQQLHAMKAWCSANPSKRKTKRGVQAFIVRWLSSAQDRGGGQAARPSGLNKQEALEANNHRIAMSWVEKKKREQEMTYDAE